MKAINQTDKFMTHMYQPLAVLTFCQSDSHLLLSGTRTHSTHPALAPYRGCFVFHSSAEWRHAKHGLSQGILASILDASIHHTEEGILRSHRVTHWLVMGRSLHSPTCTTNDYAKAVLTTANSLYCAARFPDFEGILFFV